jgi:hypothetical protein
MNAVIRSGLALLVAATIAMFVTAQQKSDKQLLDEARRDREIATQKAEADLKAARDKARSANSADAVAILKAALAELEANNAISESRKSAMIDSLKSSIRIAELSKKPGDKLTVPPAVIKDDKAAARLTDLQKQEDERKQVQAAVKAIDKLVGQQRTQEAERRANELSDQFPNNTAARVMRKKASINFRISEAKDLLAEQEKRITMAMNDVTKSSMPAKGDMEFDVERFKTISKLRKTDDLTKKEKEILQSLSKTVQPDWKGTQFQDVITQLSTLTGQTILIDKKALEDAVIGTDTAVNLTIPREVSVRTALRRVLGDLGLAYVIREETIYITTAQKARDLMTTRTYYLGDLVTANGLTNFPDQAAALEAKAVEQIIAMIKKSIDPLSWDSEGGKASIHYNAIAKALIVRQSAEVHMFLRGSLGSK